MAAIGTPAFPQPLASCLDRLPTGATAWVAFSGGADSTALLHALAQVCDGQPARLTAVHVNHGVHPDANRWATHCAARCAQLHIPFRLLELDPAMPSGEGLEAHLRQQRYSAFESLLEDEDWLLTAHHAEDQAETVLLNLMRGSGPDGLAGMPTRRRLGRGWLVRPLLNIPRATLRAWLNEYEVTWIDDPTNQDRSLDRNFVRHVVIPVLEQRWPGAQPSLGRSAAHCGESAGLLSAYADQLLAERVVAPLVLDYCQPWPLADDQLKLVVRRWLQARGAPSLPGQRLEELVRQLRQAGFRGEVCIEWQDWHLRCFQGQLWLHPQAGPASCPDTPWSGHQPAMLGPDVGVLRFTRCPPDLPSPLRIRPRSGSDKLALAGGRQRRTVKNLLQEQQVPPWLRASIPLLEMDGEPVALGDWLIAPRLADCLAAQGARLEWQPADPALRQLHAMRHGKTVEPSGPLR